MAGTTPKRGLPYPGNADVPDIAGDIQDLATAVDTQLGSRGKSIIATEETRANTAYDFLTTPDRVTGIVLPTDGLIVVAYQARWKRTVVGSQRAGIFIGSNQLQRTRLATAPAGQEAQLSATVNLYSPLATSGVGLEPDSLRVIVDHASSYGGDVTTGQSVGTAFDTSTTTFNYYHGPTYIFAAAGTYDVGIKFRDSNGTTSVRDRKLWVWTQVF